MSVDRRAIIGIDLGGTKCHGALATADGTIVAEERRSTHENGGAIEAIRRVWGSLHEHAQNRRLEIVQTVAGIPAVVDPSDGSVTRGPNVGWDGLDSDQILGGLGPFVLENDANLAAIAESSASEMLGSTTFALFSIGTGFGGALAVNGDVVSGLRGGVGEFGDMPLGPSTTDMIEPIGRLEDVVSGRGIGLAAKRLQAAKATRGLDFEPTSKGVIEAAIRGNEDAWKILGPVLERLGGLIVDLHYIVEPSSIVLDGSVGRALAPFSGRLEELVGRWVDSGPRVRISTLAPTSTVRGAIELGRSLAGVGDATPQISHRGPDRKGNGHE